MLSFLQQNLAIYLIFSGLLGLTIGSFLNVVILRLPRMMERQWQRDCRELLKQPATADEERLDLAYPPSRCPQCGHQIRAWENIPLISWLLLRGRCSDCTTPISIRYPLVEAATALLTLIVAYHFDPGWQVLAAMGFTWALIALTMIDFDTQLLPDNITLPLLWSGLLLNLDGLFSDLESAVIGAAAGYLTLWSVYQIFKRITGKEGMGYGDFKLLAAIGAWLGWQYLPLTIMASALVGALLGISLILLRGRERNLPIPFGPYLAAAGWIAMLWGDSINHAYLQWSGLG
ncbi:prepilin peptidase [endosymbiont of Ridgeia piscesae]|jgi:leader peptidase (prepilin peptidase)/N-methyltransferase|uniref:Prepilin leader peptidase/N-methyltransferase n=1 Tax=endosymbiont of Ridgeia piscesae TaxID=54398 RepID=A0A0T5Z6W9_9GAMM|nr:A24 family peptidase [endosymbiont of Ridgeia piscesae]KRT55085.1 type 4 prepilin peptidase 1 /Aspartic peptidase/MEROPS family A24A [endosymbiont of Ridgeia piscesae]KRT58649.1 type 4 prepilin peptidase 1 Aspartic peptidase MEROPS family A24A [endosymbiont of Ridgeia piscesae]